jgi:hypothetical protein
MTTAAMNNVLEVVAGCGVQTGKLFSCFRHSKLTYIPIGQLCAVLFYFNLSVTLHPSREDNSLVANLEPSKSELNPRSLHAYHVSYIEAKKSPKKKDGA